jgi:hypothetical protein
LFGDENNHLPKGYCSLFIYLFIYLLIGWRYYRRPTFFRGKNVPLSPPFYKTGFLTTLCDKVCQWLATGRWFSLYSGFSHQKNRRPQYNWNIVESGIKHNKCLFIYLFIYLLIGWRYYRRPTFFRGKNVPLSPPFYKTGFLCQGLKWFIWLSFLLYLKINAWRKYKNKI